MVLEDVGEVEIFHAAMGEQAFAIHEIQHEGAEAADGAFLDGDERGVVGGEGADERFIERFCEAGVGDGDADVFFLEEFGGLEGFR